VDYGVKIPDAPYILWMNIWTTAPSFAEIVACLDGDARSFPGGAYPGA